MTETSSVCEFVADIEIVRNDEERVPVAGVEVGAGV